MITVLTGTFSQCDAQWCLADAALNFGTDADLSVVQGDYDGDGAAETVSDELAGLAELKSDVTVGVDADGLVVSINDLPYTFGDPPTDPGAPVVAPVIPPVTPPTATPGASSSD